MRTALDNCSASTIWCMSTWEAGTQITPAIPWTTSSIIARASVNEPVKNMIPHPIDTAMNSSIPVWISRRMSNRSASAPV